MTDVIPEVAERETELPIIRDPEESWYVRQEGDGLIIGPYEQDATPWAVDGVPPDFGMELLPPDLSRIEHIVERAMQRLPVLQNAGIKNMINGPITFTPDASPLIGPAFGLPGAWLLSGSSMGIMEGGGAGWLLAHWIMDGAPPLDPLGVDPRRFGAYADRDYRIARARESFGLQFGIHYPFEERPAGRPRRTSGLHQALLARGAVMGCVNGWERPNYFGDAPQSLRFGTPDWHEQVVAESLRVHRGAGLADLSAFSKFTVSGADADRFIAVLGVQRAPSADMAIRLLHVLSPAGGIVSEFVVTRLGANRYYLSSAAAAERHDHDLLRSLSETGGCDVRVENLTTANGVLAIMGPQSRALLETVFGCRLQAPWMHAEYVHPGAVPGCEVLALRLSYIGEAGWELHVAAEHLPPLYEALQRQNPGAHDHFGAYAMNAMRLEKGFPAWGADLGSERTALEAGLVSPAAVAGCERNFIGKEAMLARAKDHPWRLAPVQLECRHCFPFGNHPLHHDGRPVGIITSAAYGPRCGRYLGLAWLREPQAAGKPLVAEVHGHECAARILRRAPFDPGHRRMRA